MTLDHAKDIFKKFIDLSQEALNIARKISGFISESTLLSIVAGLAIILTVFEGFDACRKLYKELKVPSSARHYKRILANLIILSLATIATFLSAGLILLLTVSPDSGLLTLLAPILPFTVWLLPIIYTCLVGIFLVKCVYKFDRYIKETDKTQKEVVKLKFYHRLFEFLAGTLLCTGIYLAAGIVSFPYVTAFAITLIITGATAALINEIWNFLYIPSHPIPLSKEIAKTPGDIYAEGHPVSTPSATLEPSLHTIKVVDSTENPDHTLKVAASKEETEELGGIKLEAKPEIKPEAEPGSEPLPAPAVS